MLKDLKLDGFLKGYDNFAIHFFFVLLTRSVGYF